MSAIPPDIAEKLRAYGPVINPPEIRALYAPLHEKEPYAGVRVTRDVPYGPDERNLLDLFVPEASTGPRPVLIFAHGGGFVSGNRRPSPGSPVYDNIMVWAVRHGYVGVNITYRLAPAHGWPAGAEDVARAVRWVGDHIAAHGGDASRVFAMGHSAGAVHLACYLAHREFHAGHDLGLAGAILVSGLFVFSGATAGAPEKAYFGTDPSKYAERSPFQGLLKQKLPLLIVCAEHDPPFFILEANHLADALRRQGNSPRFLLLKGHSHMSEVYAINTADTELSDAVSGFIASPSAR